MFETRMLNAGFCIVEPSRGMRLDAYPSEGAGAVFFGDSVAELSIGDFPFLLEFLLDLVEVKEVILVDKSTSPYQHIRIRRTPGFKDVFALVGASSGEALLLSHDDARIVRQFLVRAINCGCEDEPSEG